MKAASLLLCLALPFGLAACAGGKLPGETADPGAAKPTSYVPSVIGAPRGQAASSLDPPEGSAGERAQQARAQCWMKVEGQKALKGIDQRIAYVEKCVADDTKAKP